MLRVRRIRTALPRAAGRPPSDPGAREPFLGLLQGRGVASASSMRVIRHARQSGPGAVYAASVTPDARGAGGQIGNRCCDRTDVRNPQVPVRCDLWPICHSKPQGGSISSNISNIACRHMSKGQQATLPACCFRCWRGSNASRAPSSLQAPHRPRRRPREHPSARAGGCSIACAAANRRRRLLGGRRLRTRKCRGRSSPGRGKGRGSRPFGFECQPGVPGVPAQGMSAALAGPSPVPLLEHDSFSRFKHLSGGAGPNLETGRQEREHLGMTAQPCRLFG
jgi:hypothetical protein